MANALINRFTRAQWKAMRERAGVPTTFFGPSVGKKLEAWQTCWAETKALKKRVQTPPLRVQGGRRQAAGEVPRGPQPVAGGARADARERKRQGRPE